MTKYYVYEHWRLDREECFYVGKGQGNRAYSTKNRNQHWKNIVAKLERIGSAYEIRIVASGLTEKEAFDLEIQRISFWKDKADLANIAAGGVGGKLSEETKKKISIKLTGNKNGFGKHPSPEVRKKLSLIALGNKKGLGKVPTAEHRQKISVANKNRKPVHVMKKVMELSENKIFNSIVDAARHYNTHASLVSSVCSGKRKSASGRLFKFVIAENA